MDILRFVQNRIIFIILSLIIFEVVFLFFTIQNKFHFFSITFDNYVEDTSSEKEFIYSIFNGLNSDMSLLQSEEHKKNLYLELSSATNIISKANIEDRELYYSISSIFWNKLFKMDAYE